MIFKDRSDAGRQLAARLEYLRSDRPVVLALPRGGVVVAYEVAVALGAPLDVLVVRKLGAPGNPEFAIGALARGVTVLNEDIDPARDLPAGYLADVTRAEQGELERREDAYRRDRPAVAVDGRTVILVDDGLATGSTAAAAVAALRGAAPPPRRIIVAVPVGAPEAVARLRRQADEVVCLSTPLAFRAVSLWFEQFDQTSDAEVVDLLARAGAHEAAGANR